MPVQKAQLSALRYRPVFEKELYRCVVDGHFFLKKFHLSGLLLFKQMPDQSTRIVFQNEMGFTFFDFQWSAQDHFTVRQIMPQLNKPMLIKLLQKDLSLLLLKGLNTASEAVFVQYRQYYHRFTLERGYAYYVTDSLGLARIDNVGKRKRVTGVFLTGRNEPNQLADTIFLKHYKAHFTIQLTKINTSEHVAE
jgi:hypothetical protein